MSVKRSSVCRDGSDSSEPVAKRTRYEVRELEKLKDEDNSNYEPTVLDILNEYCWLIIFDHVNLQDLTRSERVSQRWRCMVLRYLQGVRLRLQCGAVLHEENIPVKKYRMMAVPVNRFPLVVAKFGRAIVAADCRCMTELRVLSQYSPNIEELTIRNNDDPLHFKFTDEIIPFVNLRRISVSGFEDEDLAKFLRHTTELEELVVDDSFISGSCLTELRNSLKTLEIKSCFRLDFNHLIATERLSELTKLELKENDLTIGNVHKLIEKTPNIEYLGLTSFDDPYNPDIELVKAICRLSRLKHLNLSDNGHVNNEWLKAFGLSCKQLQTLSIGVCSDYVTGVGIVALCRGVGQTITALDVSCNISISSEDIASCIRLCPNLEIFNVRHCPLVIENLHVVDAAVIESNPRARPLRLQLTKKSSLDSLDLDISVSDSDDSLDASDDSEFHMVVSSDSEPERASTPMEVCSELILDYNNISVFKCGDKLYSESELEFEAL